MNVKTEKDFAKRKEGGCFIPLPLQMFYFELRAHPQGVARMTI